MNRIYLVKVTWDNGDDYEDTIETDLGFFEDEDEAQAYVGSLNTAEQERYAEARRKYDEQIEAYRVKQAEARSLGFEAPFPHISRPLSASTYSLVTVERAPATQEV